MILHMGENTDVDWDLYAHVDVNKVKTNREGYTPKQYMVIISG